MDFRIFTFSENNVGTTLKYRKLYNSNYNTFDMDIYPFYN